MIINSGNLTKTLNNKNSALERRSRTHGHGCVIRVLIRTSLIAGVQSVAAALRPLLPGAVPRPGQGEGGGGEEGGDAVGGGRPADRDEGDGVPALRGARPGHLPRRARDVGLALPRRQSRLVRPQVR